MAACRDAWTRRPIRSAEALAHDRREDLGSPGVGRFDSIVFRQRTALIA